MTIQTAAIGVKSQHREYIANFPRWKKIRDVLGANCKSYLRDVGSSEPDKEYGAQRQKDYADGAVFYNFTKRTLSGMVGAVMRKPPEVKLPSGVEYLLDNCDGAGIGLVQQSQDALKEIDSMGRGGLLSDGSIVDGMSMADQNSGLLNARIQFYPAESIIDWQEDVIGSAKILTQVRLREVYEYKSENDEFTTLIGERIRVIELVDRKYQQRVFTFDNTGSQLGDVKVIEPRFGKNKTPINYIPFTFIGSDNNDSSVDAPPLETLADINIGHYRNSADVEESSFITSQPTLMVYPGQNMNASQFAEANPNGIRLGSRMGHNLGSGGGSELLQAAESNLALSLMEKKENQAVMAGAQLITPTIQVTAEAARLQRGADTSIMVTIAQNVSQAYEKAIAWCCEFMGVTGEVVFELNTEMFMQQLTAQDRAQWIADINAGLMPMRAYYAAMRAAGATNWTDEEIEEELQRQPPPAAPAMTTAVTGEIPPAPDKQQAE